MIRFHYMARTNKLDVQSLSELSNELDLAGYYSVLLTYDPMVSDNMIKAANILNTSHKIKYMPAVRTYAISPEYFGMMCRSFEEIQKNRFMVNIVSGDINSNETFLNDIVNIQLDIDTPDKRLEYTKRWIEKFISLKYLDYIPEIVMGGHSEKTIQMANDNDFMSLVSWSEYKNVANLDKFKKANRQMVSMCIVIRDTDENAKNDLDSFKIPNAYNFTLYGSKNTVKQEIINLYNSGIADIQISNHWQDDQYKNIHGLVKEMLEEING